MKKSIIVWLIAYLIIAAGLLTWNLSGMDSGHGDHGEEHTSEHGEEHGEEHDEHGEEHSEESVHSENGGH